jgi:hypothetical protein
MGGKVGFTFTDDAVIAALDLTTEYMADGHQNAPAYDYPLQMGGDLRFAARDDWSFDDDASHFAARDEWDFCYADGPVVDG